MTRLGRSLPAKQVDSAQAFPFLEVAPTIGSSTWW